MLILLQYISIFVFFHLLHCVNVTTNSSSSPSASASPTSIDFIISKITILNQSNAYQATYDKSNKLICHNYTDFTPAKLMYACDDFVIPDYSSSRSLLASNGLLHGLSQ